MPNQEKHKFSMYFPIFLVLETHFLLLGLKPTFWHACRDWTKYDINNAHESTRVSCIKLQLITCLVNIQSKFSFGLYLQN